MTNNTADNPLPIGHELTEGTPHHALTVYGSQTCGDTARARALLDTLNVAYNFYDVDKDAAMARTAAALQNGAAKTPVIDFGENNVLIEPSNDQLARALEQTGRLPRTASPPV